MRGVPRTLAIPLGILLLAGLWLGPLPALARGSFAAHMALHLGVIAVAAPLIAIGLAGTPMDPTGSMDRRVTTSAPLLMALFELVAVWAWHAPALHAAARSSLLPFALEQLSFLAAGLLVWTSAFGGPVHRRRQRAGPGAGALLLTAMHMTLLGTLLALAPRPLYAHGPDAWSERLVDQQLGGTLMLVVGGAVYLVGGLVLAARLLGDAEPALAAKAEAP